MGSSNIDYQCLSATNVANFVPTKLWFTDTNTNYATWREQMLCLIQSQGLLGFIDGTLLQPPELVGDPPMYNREHILWRRTDHLLRGWILGSLSDIVAASVVGFSTCTDLWLELQNRFLRFTNPPPAAAPPTQQKDLIEYLPLHRAALRGDWEAAKQIFENDPSAKTASINVITEKALHSAVGTGKSIHFVEKLVAEMPDESLGVTDDIGGTALTIAAAVGNTAAATILVTRKPELLYTPNNFGNFPIQVAALFAQRDVLEYFLTITKDHFLQNPYAGLLGLRLLINVIDAGFYDIALYLVEKYPDLARLKLPDSNTALKKITGKQSALCGARCFNFWERLISSCISVETIMRPQFTNGFDLESRAPPNSRTVFQSLYAMPWKFVERFGLIKKVKDKLLLRQQVLQLVKRLCKEIECLKFIEAKDIYFDAMLIAAQLGIHEVVEEIVEVFPSAIYTLSSSRQYIFHVAVENRSENVFNLTYQMSEHKHLYCDFQDSNGNNLLHLAGKLAPSHKLNEISGAALQMQREIQWYKEVEKFVHSHARDRLNNAGKSPKMVFTEEHKILKEGGEKWMKDTANSCTIAAALIATVMFAAAITVPGGNDSSTGFPIFSSKSTNSAFIVFAISDAVSLYTSATSLLMFLAILTSRYAEEDFYRVLPKRLIIGLGTLFLSITFMMVSFSATLYLTFGKEQKWVLIPVAALACFPVTSFVLLQFPLLVDLIYSTYGPGIFGKQSNRPFY